MTSMNEPEVVTAQLEQIDKLTEEANRYRTALQDIREHEYQHNPDIGEDTIEIINIAKKALEGE